MLSSAATAAEKYNFFSLSAAVATKLSGFRGGG
jgi:hypothetical protein